MDTKCKCDHDADIHDLEDAWLTDNPDYPDGNRLVWRFRCRGGREYYGHAIPCSCINLQLPDDGPANARTHAGV